MVIAKDNKCIAGRQRVVWDINSLSPLFGDPKGICQRHFVVCGQNIKVVCLTISKSSRQTVVVSLSIK